MIDLKARFRGLWARVGVEASGILLVAVPTVAWACGFNVGNAILWATGVLLLAYTIETQGMRLEMVRQNEIAIRPLLITSIDSRGPTARDRSMVVRNIGKGAALFVQIRDIEITRDDTFRFTNKFRGIDCVESGKEVDIDAYVAIEDAAGEARLKVDLLASLDPRTGNRAYNVTLSYEDIDGRRYESVMQMGQGGIRLLRHEQARRAPRSGTA